MRVLVTGGAGYIGSVITEQLVTSGHDVVVIDNLSKGYRRAVISGAELIVGELSDREKVTHALREHQIQSVIHMAASSLVSESVIKPRDYYRNNVETSLALLDSMMDAGVRRLVFSSTAAVYGEPQKQPIEETDPTNPSNTYGETKLAFERALHWASKAYNLQYTSLRYFNAAGATENFGEVHDPETHLIPAVLQAAAGARPYVEVYGEDYPTRDGTCVRDYIHVIDLARAHILALNAPAGTNRIYNLGCGGDGYTVKEVIDVARAVTRREIPTRVAPRRPGDPPVLIASSERINSELQWKPAFQDLNVIIESAWRWVINHPDGYSS